MAATSASPTFSKLFVVSVSAIPLVLIGVWRFCLLKDTRRERRESEAFAWKKERVILSSLLDTMALRDRRSSRRWIQYVTTQTMRP